MVLRTAIVATVVGVSVTAANAGTLEISAGNQQGWSFYTTNNNDQVLPGFSAASIVDTGTVTPNGDNYALHIQIGAGINAAAPFSGMLLEMGKASSTIKLTDINKMSYSFYVNNNGTSAYSPEFKLGLYTSDGRWAGQLNYVPTYPGNGLTADGQWIDVDLTNLQGVWWYSGNKLDTSTTVYQNKTNTLETWLGLFAADSDFTTGVTVGLIRVEGGSSNGAYEGLDAYIDHITFGTTGNEATTYDIVPEPASLAALSIGAMAVVMHRRK